VATSQS
jgi:hypothetical protein